MLDTNSPEYKKQLKYVKEGITITEDDEITLLSVGGLVSASTKEELEAFYKDNPPYTHIVGSTKFKSINIKNLVSHENEFRLALVNRANIFLATLRNTGCSVKRACKMSGLNRKAAENLASRSQAFKDLWDCAYEDATDELEEAGFKRAVHGVREPVFYQGEEVAQVTKYSDTLTQFMLQGRRSKVYGKKNTSIAISSESGGDKSKTKVIMGFEEDKTL